MPCAEKPRMESAAARGGRSNPVRPAGGASARRGHRTAGASATEDGRGRAAQPRTMWREARTERVTGESASTGRPAGPGPRRAPVSGSGRSLLVGRGYGYGAGAVAAARAEQSRAAGSHGLSRQASRGMGRDRPHSLSYKREQTSCDSYMVQGDKYPYREQTRWMHIDFSFPEQVTYKRI